MLRKIKRSRSHEGCAGKIIFYGKIISQKECVTERACTCAGNSHSITDDASDKVGK